jgi:hypothetical protein
MRKMLVALAVTTLVGAAPARADGASGLSFALRAAYGVPLGSAGDGAKLKDLTSGAVPIQVDAAWRFDSHWQAGAYYSWGPAFVAGAAKDALTAAGASEVGASGCAQWEQRVGIQGLYAFDAWKGVSPWVGLGAGYEWTRYAYGKLGADDFSVGVRGFEASLQLGASYRLASGFSAGPFAAVSVGQYQSSVRRVENGGATTTEISDKGIHEWLQVGIRGSYDL